MKSETDVLSRRFTRVDSTIADQIKEQLSRPYPGMWVGSVYWEPKGRPLIGAADPMLYRDPDGDYWLHSTYGSPGDFQI